MQDVGEETVDMLTVFLKCLTVYFFIDFQIRFILMYPKIDLIFSLHLQVIIISCTKLI